MKTIYKFPLNMADDQTIRTHLNSRPLYVAMQNGILCLWAEVNTSFPEIEAAIRVAIVGTGNLLPDFFCTYIGSVQERIFVWHVYAMTKDVLNQ